MSRNIHIPVSVATATPIISGRHTIIMSVPSLRAAWVWEVTGSKGEPVLWGKAGLCPGAVRRQVDEPTMKGSFHRISCSLLLLALASTPWGRGKAAKFLLRGG